MGLSTEQAAFSLDLAKLITRIHESGYAGVIAEVYRTPEQAALNAKKGIGIANSLHCQKLAADVLLFKDGVYLADGEHYRQFGDYWESLSVKNRYGGDWNRNGIHEKGENDFNHFERKA